MGTAWLFMEGATRGSGGGGDDEVMAIIMLVELAFALTLLGIINTPWGGRWWDRHMGNRPD